jgi:hypothetical protein
MLENREISPALTRWTIYMSYASGIPARRPWEGRSQYREGYRRREKCPGQLSKRQLEETAWELLNRKANECWTVELLGKSPVVSSWRLGVDGENRR